MQGRRVTIDIFGSQKRVFFSLHVPLHFFEVGYIYLGISVRVWLMHTLHIY